MSHPRCLHYSEIRFAFVCQECTRKYAWIALFCCLQFCPRTSYAELTFTGLGSLSGWNDGRAYGVADDGSVVTGWGQDNPNLNTQEAFRWTESTGMTGLGGNRSRAYAVSSDGNVIVGHTESGGLRQFQAFRWTESGGMTVLSDSGTHSEAYATSADGSVVVGIDQNATDYQPFRWTEATGMERLGILPGGGTGSTVTNTARAVSADGSVVGGESQSGNGNEAFIWTASSGMVGLGDLVGGAFDSQVNGMTSDGSVVVGTGATDVGREAFIWTMGSGMIGLGSLAPGELSLGNAITDDGRIVVGKSGGTSLVGSGTAMIWDELNGMRSIQVILESGGLDLTGWQLASAYDISGDGLTVVGVGVNPSGNLEAWRATFNAVPEPSSALALMGLGSIALFIRRRKSVDC